MVRVMRPYVCFLCGWLEDGVEQGSGELSAAGLHFTSTIAELIVVEKDTTFIEGYMSSSKMIYRWQWRKTTIITGDCSSR
ncbi:hypothetical protein Hanom_Chr02g00168281 [Helianthus anomalus]